jgi:flagellar L-ring protein precursor FlgH
MLGRYLCLALVVIGLGGCQPPMPPPLPPPPPPPPAPPPLNGSLWRPERASNYAALDVRAHFPGDLLTVLISERSQGSRDANTEASAKSSISASVEDFFGIPASSVKLLPKGFNPTSIVKAETARESVGDGETKRSGSLTASITVRVDAVDYNGNLHVRGDKVVSVNREQEHIVLTGVVRPEDIASDNSVLSSRLADARIDYYGRGVVGDKQNVPLVHRLYDWIWPF